MSSTSAIIAHRPAGTTQATKRRGFLYETVILFVSYAVTSIVASSTISLCGPGCCFVFYTVFAGASGVLMLRKPLLSRCFCLAILFCSLYGMWHEKEVRDDWHSHMLQLQLNDLEPAKTQPAP